MKNILRFFRFEDRVGIGLLSVNSLPEMGFVSRESTAFEIFRRGARQLKLNRASLVK